MPPARDAQGRVGDRMARWSWHGTQINLTRIEGAWWGWGIEGALWALR